MNETTSKPSICFVSHFAYGALAGIDNGHIGGIEIQTSTMARWLANQGYKVSMITWDEGQQDGQEVNSVWIFKMCRKDSGTKGLRFFWPKWTSMNAAMKRADADIYYYNCGDLGLGQVVMWCRRHKRKSVYSVASEPNCDPKLPKLKSLRERILYQYGLKHVDAVIVQTYRQKQMLEDGFGIRPTVIPMPCLGPSEEDHTCYGQKNNGSQHVLWVGRISKEKRFEWLLNIAKRCPGTIFDVLGSANSDTEYSSELIRHSAGIKNVKMHGRVSHAKMFSYYRQSKVLCCTSIYEGFPNTFLEAWSCGIPVVSTFDPDGIVAKFGLGWTASSIDGVIDGLSMAITSSEKWHAASRAALSYYLKNHTVNATMPKFEKLFLDVNEKKSCQRPTP